MSFFEYFIVVILGLALNFMYCVLCYLAAPKFIKKIDTFLQDLEKKREDREEW